MDERWVDYHRWNSAIAAVVFTEGSAGHPVYLDMDDEIFFEIAAHLTVNSDAAKNDFIEAVRRTVNLQGTPSDVFRAHLTWLGHWQRRVARQRQADSRVEPPPTLALLAAFSLAAEAMGSDQNVAAHAYYPRLAAVLGATGEKPKERLHSAYQATAERLWRGLNDWLTIADGRYGVPTAFALTHRYIGLPMSQALIRAADRRHLSRMFRQMGLPPGSDLPPADMRRALDTWIGQVPCPASKNLQALWNRTGAQERIAEVAVTELSNWDNSVNIATSGVTLQRKTGDIRLMAQLRRFPKAELRLSFLATMPTTVVTDELIVESAEGAPRLDVIALSGLSLSPRTAGSIDPGSLVEGVLRLVDPRSKSRATRHPHRVVPFRRDELTNAFVESERVQLGEDSLVLVKNQGQLADEVEKLLDATARPGFQRQTKLRGLPAGWCLFTDVQVLMTPSSQPRPDLNALVPLIASQLSIAGGMKLPGNLRKWSGLRPPEVRAISQLDDEIELSLSRTELGTDETSNSQIWRSQRGILLVDLRDLDLADGDYELMLDGGGRALQRTTLRLRTADTPDRWSWDTAAKLGYIPARPLSAVAGENEPRIRGALPPPHTPVTPPPHAAEIGRIWWSAERPPRQDVVPIVIASPDPGSCVVTGAHRIYLPPTPQGRPTSPMMSGSCSQCGIVKRYPSWPRRSTGGHAGGLSIEIREDDRIANVSEAEGSTSGYDVALDALVHLGGGSVSALDRVASQIDASAIATDSFRRNLEALGHVDLSRNERHDVIAWSVAPPMLAETTDGSFYLVGAWSHASRECLRAIADDAGGEVTVEKRRDEPTSWYVEGLDKERLGGLLPQVRAALPVDSPIAIVTAAAENMLRHLPPLSAVAADLLRVPMPGARKIERFNLQSVHWEPVGAATTPGAYRLLSEFRTLYVHRSEADVERQEAAVGTAQLVKHIEAQRMGRPLVGYYPQNELLAVPLGAELPGLYGRAAVLSSGCLTRRVKDQRAIAYCQVNKTFALAVLDLLAS